MRHQKCNCLLHENKDEILNCFELNTDNYVLNGLYYCIPCSIMTNTGIVMNFKKE